jgi:hypothetical protein
VAGGDALKRVTPIAAAAALVALWEARLDAYLDPGSGSLLVQLLLGGLAGVAVAARVLWRRLRERLPGGRREPAPPPVDE